MTRYLLIFLLLTPFASHANSLVLRSDDITIVRKTMVEVSPEPLNPDIEENNKAVNNAPIMKPLEPIKFTVQIRSQEAVRLHEMHSLNRLRDDTGVMVLMTRPVDMPIVKIAVYTPVDVLMVNDEGRIVQIVPEIVLGRLEDFIDADEPLKAFIYLKSGIAEEKMIKPGDVVDHPSFTPAPTVLK